MSAIELRKKYFVVYDLNDNFIMYFDNVNELLEKVSIPLKKIVQKFNLSPNEYIHVVIDNKLYKLFAFTDYESEQWN